MELTSNRLGLALALGFVVSACAAPDIPDGTAADDPNSADAANASNKKPATKKPPASSNTAGSESGPPSGTATPAPATPATSTPATPPPTSCTGLSADACFDCCNTASGGTLAPADNVFGQCACGGGPCTAVCDASFCSGTAPSAACSSCLSATCQPAETAACTSASCKAGLQCAQQCP